MMKIQRMKLIWTAAVLLAAGCSQEQVTEEGAYGEEVYSDVRIEPCSSLVGEDLLFGTATRAAVDGNQPMTFYFLRANETGVGTDIYPLYNNTVLSATRPGGGGVQPLRFEYDLFYLVSGAKSKLTGWYPKPTSVANGVVTWNIDGTQEVLTAAAREGSKTTPIQPFEFKQALSQLRFRLQAKDTDAQASWGRITGIRLLNQPSVCLYDSGTNDDTGNVTFDPTGATAHFEAKNIATGQVPMTPTVMSDPMMIVPQKDVALTLEIEGSTGKTGRVSIASTTYEPGKAYNIDIVLEYMYVNLSTNGTANCYVVISNILKDYSFDATTRGNGNESTTDSNVSGISYSTLPDLATAKEARVIWQTGTSATTGLVVDPASVKLEDGLVKFSLGDATEGNAVIGLFASSAAEAPCLWSWHIWLVNGLPADVDCVKMPSPTSASPTFKMMGINLGAYNNAIGDPKSIGLIYQWGRKDPFPGGTKWEDAEPTNIYGSISNNGTAVSLVGNYTLPKIARSSAIGTEAWAVQYPGVFITNNVEPYDWMVTKNNYLWGTPWKGEGLTIGGYDIYNNNQGVKSIYDPCPVGYRVPPQDFANKAVIGTWNNGNSLTGIVSSGSFYFPASGKRQYSSGVFSSIGAFGFGWSSSPSGLYNSYGGYLVFGRDVTPCGTGYRTYGMPVRCVRE